MKFMCVVLQKENRDEGVINNKQGQLYWCQIQEVPFHLENTVFFFKSLGLLFFKIFINKVFYAHLGSIYLIKNAVKAVILWNITT